MQKITNGIGGFERVSKWKVEVDGVVVTATFFTPRNNPSGLKVHDVIVNSPFSNPHLRRDVSKAYVRVSSQAENHVTVVAEESPRVLAWVSGGD